MSQAVQEMFSRIAWRYDCANDVLSCGLHRYWRQGVIKAAKLQPAAVVVDLCTGTGDLAFAAAKAVGPQGKVYGIDFVASMIELAEAKTKTKLCRDCAEVVFSQGDALAVNLPDEIADAVTISFGIRNVDEPLRCLSEMLRLLKPSGNAVILEFGQPMLPVFAPIYRSYCKYIMPVIGGLITGSKDAYTYLPETSQHFPAGKVFAEMFSASGFKDVVATPLLSGLAYIYSGRKG